MIISHLFQRGIAAGIFSALFALATGPPPWLRPSVPTRSSQAAPPSRPRQPAATPRGQAGCRGKPAALRPPPAPLRRPGGHGPRRRVPLASYGRLGRLHGPVRPLEDLLCAEPAQGPAAEEPQPGSGLSVRVVPPGRERQERGRARARLHRQGQRPRQAAIGTASYALLTKDANAWLKNPAEEGQAIATMAKSQSVTVKTQSARGNSLTDRYSLSGFGRPSSAPARNAPETLDG